MLKSKLLLLIVILVPFFKAYTEQERYPDKILICGVCQNVENAFENTVRNIEELGSYFSDYAVIIYENNSTDNTAQLFRNWSTLNRKVTFISESVDPAFLPSNRIEKIARARNCVLEEARKLKYSDYPFLVMADLDFLFPWPVEEIAKSIYLPIEWDCISANGKKVTDNNYFDRYAFRDKTYSLGPELIDTFWRDHDSQPFELRGDALIPVFSAFGGLAIYKTETILKFHYYGVVCDSLPQFYQEIFLSVPETNQQLQRYFRLYNLNSKEEASIRDVLFRSDYRQDPQQIIKTCCEHVALHAAMFTHGYGKFFINPKMIMYYPY